MTSTISTIPIVSMRWECRVAGRVFFGDVQMPDCGGALEQVSRALMADICERHGMAQRDFQAGHVFVFRPNDDFRDGGLKASD